MSKITVLGDVMLDQYCYGQVKRVNPEAPGATLLNADGDDEYRLGGAANVAANIAGMLDGENHVHLIGIVGKKNNKLDMAGLIFQRICKEHNFHLHKILKEDRPTTMKTRFVETDREDQLLRVDREKKAALDEQSKKRILQILKQNQSEYIVISDYCKGVIDKYIVEQIKEHCGHRRIFVDTKTEDINLFRGVYLIKPNLKEFCKMVGVDEDVIKNEKNKKLEDKNIEQYATNLAKDFNSNLIITRSKRGATLVTTAGKVQHIDTDSQEAVDVSGAGDTFLAAVVVGLSKGYALPQAVQLANKASGIAVGISGTAVITAKELGI